MSKKTLKTLRSRSFHFQEGRCYYCDAPMWFPTPGELSLRSRASHAYQCTAEHLLARQDGGKDVASNVVAACDLCNLRRHKASQPCPIGRGLPGSRQTKSGGRKMAPSKSTRRQGRGVARIFHREARDPPVVAAVRSNQHAIRKHINAISRNLAEQKH